MKIFTKTFSRLAAISLALFAFASLQTTQAQAPRPSPAPAAITLGEAQTIIDGAIAYAEERDLRMAIVVMDQSGYEVASARMDGAAFRNITFAEGKAYASALYAQTTEELGALATTQARSLQRHHGNVSGQILSRRRRRAFECRRHAGGRGRHCRPSARRR